MKVGRIECDGCQKGDNSIAVEHNKTIKVKKLIVEKRWLVFTLLPHMLALFFSLCFSSNYFKIKDFKLCYKFCKASCSRIRGCVMFHMCRATLTDRRGECS